jgi:hypothetical protein
MGVGVTTLVTIMVVMLLTAFSVLTLVSARSDLRLSTMAAEAAQQYYAADGVAEEWYAGLCAYLEDTQSADWEHSLTEAGYEVSRTESGVLCVTEQFALGTNRQLNVTVAVNKDGKPTIIQWQSGSAQRDDQG